MKKKINMKLLQIVALAIAATMVLVVAVFYNLFKNQVLSDLEISTDIIEEYIRDNPKRFYNLAELNLEKLRITIINANGLVEYDSEYDNDSMENHNGRPEIMQARKDGEAKSVRHSVTMGKTSFYYAKILENGNILRTCREAESIWYMARRALLYVAGLLIMIFLVCIVATHYLTKGLVKPIEEIAKNMDNIEKIPIYKELAPFVNTIQSQHEDILKNAKMRQEFTANVSHELKTPLTSISGYAELIENGMATEKDIARFAHEIHHNATRLLNQINDIIHLSELDVADKQLQTEPVNLYQIAENCVEMIQVNARKHNVSINFDGIPSLVMGDRGLLEEVVYNLCDNAIRYNNIGGSVNVTVKPKNDKVIFTVEDTGIGIPKKYQERIFERFYRVDKSRSQSTGGTGLGLAIVKHIVVQHNGDMKLESEKGKGTKIQIIFEKKEW